jgi:hypothetical protein
MGSQFSIVRGSDGLDPGETTRAITLKSLHGYTSVAPSAEMLSHKEFVDVRADLFAKYSSTQWKQIRAVPVERRLASR